MSSRLLAGRLDSVPDHGGEPLQDATKDGDGFSLLVAVARQNRKNSVALIRQCPDILMTKLGVRGLWKQVGGGDIESFAQPIQRSKCRIGGSAFEFEDV